MVSKITNLNQQYNSGDRRQQNVPVEVERRSGKDRRASNRNENKSNNSQYVKDGVIAVSGCIIPPIHKVVNAFDDFTAKDGFRAVIEAIQTGNEFPADLEDIKNAFFKSADKNIDYSYQEPFAATRNTVMSKFKWCDKIKPYDKTLFECTSIQKVLKKIFKIKGTDVIIQKGCPTFRAQGNFFQKVIARATMRIPVLSLLVGGMCEVPSIVEAKDKINQTEQSVFRLGTLFGCSSIIGAACAFKGAKASLIGQGAGVLLGAYIDKKANPFTDQSKT